MTENGQLLYLLDKIPNVRAGVVGDLMADRFIYGTANRLSPEAPVPVVQISRRALMPGGAANVGSNILRLGAKLSLFGVLGEDEAGRDVAGALTAQGADLRGVVYLPERPTSVKTRIVAQSQHMLRYDEEVTDPIPESAATAILEALTGGLSSFDILVFSDYAKGLLSASLVATVIKRCREAGVKVVVDPKPVNIELFAGADLIKPNMNEALRLTGRERAADEDEMDQVCREVRARAQAKNVIVTGGNRGMFVLAGDKYVHLPGMPREVYDVAGAGDTTLAAVALAMGCGADLLTSARLGNLAGSIAVGKLGTSVVSRDEMRAELGEHDD